MLTGNPFVDTGLAVLAAMSKKESIDDIKTEDIVELHKNGEILAKWNSRLKSMSMIFTVNNVLSNPAIKDPAKRLIYYGKLTTAILNSVVANDIDEHCECCGNPKSLDIDGLVRRTLVPIGYKDEKRYIGRDWFPLAGSLTSDAQSLPASSRPINLCAKCLFAVHYLPLGVMLIRGRLTLFQSTDRQFWYEIIKDQVHEALQRIASGKFDTIGSKEGAAPAIRRLLGVMKSLRGDSKPGTSLFLWQFSNSGTGPDCRIDEIPNNALVFLYNAARHGLSDELLDLVRNDRNPQFSLLASISSGNDYRNLYPYKKFPGVSQKLFFLYQNNIRGIPINMLHTANAIAAELKSKMEPKKFEELGKDLENNLNGQNMVRKHVVDMVGDKRLNVERVLDYADFGKNKVSINGNLWRFVKYYMHHASESFFSDKKDAVAQPSQDMEKEKMKMLLKWVGGKIYNDYVEEKGHDRFSKDVLGSFGSGKIGANWLRTRFVIASERHLGFGYDAWKFLFLDDSDRERTFDALYVLRLLWTQWHAEKTIAHVEPVCLDIGKESRFDMHKKDADSINQIASDLLASKGKEKYRSYVLRSFRTGKLGLGYIRKKMAQMDQKYYRDDLWELMLQDKEGNNIAKTRLFQAMLLFASRARME